MEKVVRTYIDDTGKEQQEVLEFGTVLLYGGVPTHYWDDGWKEWEAEMTKKKKTPKKMGGKKC